MSNDSAKRRGWIKNIAIIFLIILLLLTFFSNTILTYSLPEVSAQYTQYGSISSSVKLDGTIKANESYKVIYEPTEAGEVTQTRRVKSVYVKEGDIVEKDQAILAVEGGMSAEREALQKEYDSLKKEYDLGKINDNVSYLESSKAIEEAQTRYNDAVAERDKVKKLYQKIMNGTATAADKSARAEEIKQKKKDLTKKIADLDEKIALTEAKLAEAKGAATAAGGVGTLKDAEQKFSVISSKYEGLKKNEADLASEYASAQKNVEDMRKSNTFTQEVDSLKKERDTFQREYDDLTSSIGEQEEIKQKNLRSAGVSGDLDRAIESINAEIEYYQGQIDMLSGISYDDEMTGTIISSTIADFEKKIENDNKRIEYINNAKAADAMIKELEKQRSGVSANIKETDKKLSEAEAKISYIGVGGVSDVELFKAERDAEVLGAKHEAAAKELEDYTPTYEEAKANLDALKKQSDATGDVDKYSKELDSYKSAREKAQTELDALADPDDIETQLKAAEANVKSSKSDLDILNATTYQSSHSTSLDRAEQKKQLDELEKKIKEYGDAPESVVVTAPIAGRVVALYSVPGESVTSGATVADIEIADKGYTCEVTVSTEEARKISVGSPVTIPNSWWYSNIEASIVQIRSDVQSQGKNKIVIFEVKGDVYEGQQVSFSVGDRSASYECVLPNSAVHKDSEGDFVLTVESKKTPLGVRYKAHRVPIEIVASDDTKSAVSGLLGSEFVITNATSPISDGQSVRLAEN